MSKLQKNMDIDEAIKKSIFIQKWKDEQISNFKLKYGNRINTNALLNYLDAQIQENLYIPEALLENNYLKKTAKTDLLQIIDFIELNKPIIGGNGVLYYQHSQKENPLLKWIMNIMDSRKLAKFMRSKYDKGTNEWLIYEMRQLTLKIIINSLYGGFGYRGFIFANLFLSMSITSLGQTTISAAAMGFEAFLANNLKFVEESEVFRFVNFCKLEADERKKIDPLLFKNFKTIEREKVVKKLIDNCAFRINDRFFNTINEMVNNLDDHHNILLFFKNNLYAFCEVDFVKSLIIKIHLSVDSLNEPDIKKLDDENKDRMNTLWQLLYTFVVFDHPVYDRVRKNKYMYKKVVAYEDTDSNFIVLGPWVRYIETIIPDSIPSDKNELKKFHFKIVNLMTILIGNVVASSFACLTNSLNIDPEYGKKLAMKNEFYFSRILFTSKKKRYVARPLLQEGIELPEGKDYEYKGFDFIKSTTKKDIKDFYSKICYDDILTPDNIDVVKILSEVMSFEERMKKLIKEGDRRFFKQSNIKAAKEYKNPYSIQGIKAILLWNTLNPEFAIQLPSDVDIIPINLEKGRRKVKKKVAINETSIWMVPIGTDSKTGEYKYMNNSGKEMVDFSQKYPGCFKILSDNILTNPNPAISSMGLNYIAMPKNSEIKPPEWLYDIIDIDKIVNDALSLFNPILKSLGIFIVKGANNMEHYSNIVEI